MKDEKECEPLFGYGESWRHFWRYEMLPRFGVQALSRLKVALTESEKIVQKITAIESGKTCPVGFCIVEKLEAEFPPEKLIFAVEDSFGDMVDNAENMSSFIHYWDRNDDVRLARTSLAQELDYIVRFSGKLPPKPTLAAARDCLYHEIEVRDGDHKWLHSVFIHKEIIIIQLSGCDYPRFLQSENYYGYPVYLRPNCGKIEPDPTEVSENV